jgi:hypothetical protein
MSSDISYILSVFIGLYLINYGPPQNVVFFLMRFYYKSIHFVNHYRHFLLQNYNTNSEEEKRDSKEELKSVKKYEDKYLTEIRNLDKNYIFTDEEEALKVQKYLEFFNLIKETNTSRINEIKESLDLIQNKLVKYEESNEDEYCLYVNEDDEDFHLGETKEERIKTLNTEKLKLSNELDTLTNFEKKEGGVELMKQAEEQSEQFIISQRLDKLKNCFVMESTPLGNVLMIYDKERDSFKYYSDNSIPYRYLEVVARKYVKQFGCRPVFVDMEEELKLADEKWVQDKKEKEEKAEEEKKRKDEAVKNNTVLTEEKKNVFAKFKHYNKTAGTGHVSKAGPPKNSIPNKSLTEKRENDKILLKDKANRYTYEGKFVNFSFLKKVDRKAVNKKFAMTFSDFKKLQTK